MADLRLLKLQVQRQLKRNLAQAEHYFHKTFALPDVNYQLRGVKAGVAYLQQNEIRLNPQLLAENGQAFIEQVVPHELAHLLVYQQFGRVKPHGREWKMMMEDVLGVPAEIYHRFDVSQVRQNQQQFLYRCSCQTHSLTARRHNAIVRGSRRYLCKLCRAPLVFAA